MEENISYIPARLKSAVKNGYVTGAADIFDDVLKLSQEKINEIVLNDSSTSKMVKLTATPSVIFSNQQSTIDLIAESSVIADIITISGGNIDTFDRGIVLTVLDTITPENSGDIVYTAIFNIGDLRITTNCVVNVVYPIVAYSGPTWDSIPLNPFSPGALINPKGTYNITVENDEDYIFFLVPRDMNINNASLSGLKFPLEEAVDCEIRGINYKYYRSSNTYDSGNLTVIIS